MFSYKILPLALLISLPAFAMDGTLTPASALDSTLLASNNLSAALEEAQTLQKQIDELQAKKKTAVSNKKTFIDQLEAKYKAKCDEICGLDLLKLEASKKETEAERAKISALEELDLEYAKIKDGLEKQLHDEEIKHGKTKSVKEKEHDTIIAALAKIKLQREEEIKTASAKRDDLYKQITQARATDEQPRTGWLSLLGL